MIINLAIYLGFVHFSVRQTFNLKNVALFCYSLLYAYIPGLSQDEELPEASQRLSDCEASIRASYLPIDFIDIWRSRDIRGNRAVHTAVR